MATRLTSIPLVLFLLLCLPAPSPAAPLTPPPDGGVLAFEEEELEAEAAGEETEEECEEGEEGFEECEEVEAEAKGNKRMPPEECLLRSARAHAAVDGSGKKLKLTIGYTTYEPTKARIEVGHIATLQRHLGRSGVLRVTKKLGAGQSMKRIVVRIRLPGRDAGCPFRRLVLFPR